MRCHCALQTAQEPLWERLLGLQSIFRLKPDAHTVAIGVIGDPTAPGNLSGGAVKKQRDRLLASSQAATRGARPVVSAKANRKAAAGSQRSGRLPNSVLR